MQRVEHGSFLSQVWIRLKLTLLSLVQRNACLSHSLLQLEASKDKSKCKSSLKANKPMSSVTSYHSALPALVVVARMKLL